jgi:hypothetical protein
LIDGEIESVILYRYSSALRPPELKLITVEPRVHSTIGYSAKDAARAFFVNNSLQKEEER